MKKNNLFLILLLLLSIWIFRSWLQTGIISSGDFDFYFNSNFKDYFLYPFAWNWHLSNGLGGFASPLAWIASDYTLPIFVGRIFHWDWSIIERFFYLFPFLILNLVSTTFLYKKLFLRNPFFLLAPFIYLFNTYIFMMVGGGQIVGISLSYAIFPLVLAYFIMGVETRVTSANIRHSIITGLLYALLIFFDLRFAYILTITVVLYFIFIDWKQWKNIVYAFIPFGIAGLLHAFWILPVLMSHQNPAQSLGSAFNSLQSVKYFSFAKLENSISLLHPTWPENIFGKVGFMRAEFLIIPIVAFASLLFLNKAPKKVEQYTEQCTILFFVFLGLIGAFLAKGANDPFGSVYLWMFQHVPGFVMYRDPSKWYTLVALSYSILIPFTVWQIYEWLKDHRKFSIFKFQFSINSNNVIFNVQNLLVLLFVVFWLFTIRQAVFGQLGGTFKSTSIPSEYVSFANYLSNEQNFSRTLWVPTTQRFAFSSQNHPAVSAENLFNIYDEKSLIKKLRQSDTEKLLQDAGVRYVIVPSDSQKEIFLKDRLYSESLYKKTVADVSKIEWLIPNKKFGHLKVFEIKNSKDHFWISSASAKVSYRAVSQVEYTVFVKNAAKGERLVFSESNDPHWTAMSGNYKVANIKYKGLLNSFVLPKDGSYTLDIYYMPQRWEDIGVWISLGTLILVAGSLIMLRRKS